MGRWGEGRGDSESQTDRQSAVVVKKNRFETYNKLLRREAISARMPHCRMFPIDHLKI